MTNTKRALQHYRAMLKALEDSPIDQDTVMFVREAVSALEKQLPKKVIERHYECNGEPQYIKKNCPNGCPVQLYPATARELSYEHIYCNRCGQRIEGWDDWEE